MDPSTVITLLSFNLIGMGGLLHLIARQMADPAGLRGFSVGALVFDLSFLPRLVMGFGSGSALGLVSDAGMVFATLCFTCGLRQFSGRAPFGRRRIALTLTVYLAAALTATAIWQGVGRHAALNLALALAYGRMSLVAFTGAPRATPTLRPPLRVLALLVGVLSLATAARVVGVVSVGLEPLFVGPWAQAYYTYTRLAAMLLGPNLLWMVFVRLNARLSTLATHDALTQSLNRRGFEEALQRHFGARPPVPLALLLVDVDHFKRINDTHGHAAGDAVLCSVARVLGEQVRGSNFVARWGGEEFMISCQGADAAWSAALAERLRRAVQETRHAVPGGLALDCTVSIGVSPPFTERRAWEAAARTADAALYRAKHEGRNRVVVAGGGTTVGPPVGPTAVAPATA